MDEDQKRIINTTKEIPNSPEVQDCLKQIPDELYERLRKENVDRAIAAILAGDFEYIEDDDLD